MKNGLSEQLKHLPKSPGVYIYRDEDGNALYVGKAKNLRNRVRQYFTGKQQVRTSILVSSIDSLEVIVAASEKEALLLESNLIKSLRPRFNIEHKDDKSYPFFRLTVQEDFPRFEITRTLARDGSQYFGPFTDVGSARKLLTDMQRAFPVRRCRGARPGGRSRPGRPCLDFQMGRCLGPCEEKVSREEYGRIVRDLTDFLKGKGRKLIRQYEKDMERLSAELRYEEAARVRDRIRALRSVMEDQNVVGDPQDDLDVLGTVSADGIAVVTCLFVRSGLIVGRHDLILEGSLAAPEAAEAYLSSHYQEEGSPIPPRILLPVGIEFAKEYADVLSDRAGRSVRIQLPARGKGMRLVRMANENANQTLRSMLSRRKAASDLKEDLAKALHLPGPPSRIECMDISHTSGRNAYGSIVAWEDGGLVKDDYRLFIIRRQARGGDDYAALEEVVERRFSGSQSNELRTPDLLVVDGGKGQLARVKMALSRVEGPVPALAALSKAKSTRRREGPGAPEEVYLPGRSNPISLGASSTVLHLLQMLRDEAHRFALMGHRRKRGQKDLVSALDGIEGVGPVRRKTLLSRYRSFKEIQAAPVEEIASLRGFNRKIADRIKEKLNYDTGKED
jgi:excinuclease ABC subunit C